MAREKDYGKQPVVIVFKTSNRSNAKIKLKKFKTKNIDEVLDASIPLPGIPDGAEILELGVGEKFEKFWNKKYKL
jgi:hypothetical protein